MVNVKVDLHANIINNKIRHIKKDWGIFFTPQWVVDFMISLINENILTYPIKILEPACGICQFLLGIRNTKPHIFRKSSLKIGVEINNGVMDYIKENNLAHDINIIHSDYLLWEPEERFDIIIGNPPYGIPSLSKHYTIRIDNKTKSEYKKIYKTWYGKYNVYGAFIEKSIRLLKENGQLIFIVPATFMILDEFKKLRDFLATEGKTELIYMGPNIFRPEADVTTVVLKFLKSESENGKLRLFDYYDGNLKLIIENNSWKGDVILFSTEFSQKVDEICSYRIRDIYTIRISPRTPEIKYNSDIIKTKVNPDEDNLLPILNGKNLKIGEVVYKATAGYYIDKNKKTRLRKFFDKPHIVIGLGFRGKRQVGSAYDYKAYPWMGDVYHLLRKHTLIILNFDLKDREVVDILNSEIMRRYVKDVFRDITYHFNITQLGMLPLPTKRELKKLKKLLSRQEMENKVEEA